MVEPGRTCLGGRYELGGLIAAGGMGQVWRGTDVLLGRPVAVKVLRSEYTGDPSFLARFRAEAQNAAALSHPRIAAVYDYGETTAEDGSGETLAYLVMELVAGQPLSQLLRGSGRLDPATTLRILGQTAAGLAEAHRAGMVHRDVKPGNILITPHGDVKITDFGIASSARSVALTRTGQVLGTPQYLSPEQAEGRQATPASDVYALGLIGYECLTGHPAFDGDNAVTIALKQVREEPEPLPDELPARIRGLVRRALSKDPARRMPDGAAVVAAIEAVRAGGPVDGDPSTGAEEDAGAPAVRGAAAGSRRHRRSAGGTGSTRPPVRRRSGRSRAAVVLAPLLGLLAGAGIAAVVLQGLSDAGPTTAEAAEQREGDAAVVLDAADYVGRPAAEVAAELTAMGLAVQQETRRTGEVPPGAVAAVEPAGTALSPGDAVVLVVAQAPAGDAAAGAGVAAPGTAAGPGTTAPRSQAPTSGAPSAPSSSIPSSSDPSSSALPAPSTPPGSAEGTAPGSTAPGSTAPGSTAPGSTAPGSTAPGSGEPTETPAEEQPAEAPAEEQPAEAPAEEPADEPAGEETEPAPAEPAATSSSPSPS